jgi:excisionase family DNA binding protein
MPTKHLDPLTIDEAARLIGVTASALRKWKSQGEGPAFYKAGHALRYQRDAVLRWIEQHTVEPDRPKVT